MPAPQHDQFNACTRIAAQCIFTPTDQGGFFFFNTWLMTPHVTSPRTLLSPPTAVILRGLSSNIVTTLTPQSSSSYTPPPPIPSQTRNVNSSQSFAIFVLSTAPTRNTQTRRNVFFSQILLLKTELRKLEVNTTDRQRLREKQKCNHKCKRPRSFYLLHECTHVVISGLFLLAFVVRRCTFLVDKVTIQTIVTVEMHCLFAVNYAEGENTCCNAVPK